MTALRRATVLPYQSKAILKPVYEQVFEVRGKVAMSAKRSHGFCVENSSATLKVRNANSAGSGWASIVESEDGGVGRFYVGYDRGRKQFMLIDAEDPAYAAYQTDGWLDGKLTLTAVNRSAQSADRCVYEVKGSREFTVVWERWKVRPG